jgi:hypothetical protein
VDAQVNAVVRAQSRAQIADAFKGGGGTMVGLGLQALELEVKPMPATTLIASDFEFGGDFSDWPVGTSLRNIVMVCVPAWGSATCDQGNIDQMTALAERYGVAPANRIVMDSL